MNLPAPPGWKTTSQAEIDKENAALRTLDWDIPEASPVMLYSHLTIDSDGYHESIVVFEIPASAVSEEANDFFYFHILKPEGGLPIDDSREEAEGYVAALPELAEENYRLNPGYDQEEYERLTGVNSYFSYSLPEFSVEPMGYGGYAVRERCTLIAEFEGEPTTRQLGNQMMIFKGDHLYVILLRGWTTGDMIKDDRDIIEFIQKDLSFD